MLNKKLITTAIAYANGAPHIGHAFEFIVADVIARHERVSSDAYFITGMDEHGQKIEQKAKEKNISPQNLVDTFAETFKKLDDDLGISYDFFVRTSDKEKHYRGAQALWRTLQEKGDLEKRTYTSLYCVGCEEFKKEADLNESGECPDHLKKPEVVEEENYFFKLSKYTEEIKAKILSDEVKIYPESRKNEIIALLERGLEDVSFSRPTHKVSWGIPVPEDDTQVMYVWCDALANYITAIGYGTDSFDEERWRDTTHVIGKDILRFHAAIWPGMLLSAGLSLPKKILVHGHITSGGQKMSKSLGNVIDPQELLAMFDEPAGGLAGEALRFVLLYKVPSFEDGDLTIETIKEAYTAHLANGIGNLTNRIMRMVTNYGVAGPYEWKEENLLFTKLTQGIREDFNNKRVDHAIQKIFTFSQSIDLMIQEQEPFKVFKTDPEKAKEIVALCLAHLQFIAHQLTPFMPLTSSKILECIRENKMPEKPLFNRLP